MFWSEIMNFYEDSKGVKKDVEENKDDVKPDETGDAAKTEWMGKRKNVGNLFLIW